MKNNYLHKFFAFTLVLIVLIPITVQAVHALDNHKHQICTAIDVKHIHQQDIDCSIFHQQIDNNSFDLSTNFEAYDPQLIACEFDAYKEPNYTSDSNTKSSRGPPYFII